MSRKLLAYAQLLRLPNVFTALADIGLGWFVTGGAWPRVAAVVLASACCYCAGMVWNDVFDIEQDARERPFRPLPSGRVSLSTARRLGLALFAAALAFGAVAGTKSFAVTAAIVVAVLLYDSKLKRTWAGPLGMGACRFLNVLLGLSVAPADAVPWLLRIHLASIVGIYIVGVTWFARTEARTSDAGQLWKGAIVMATALGLALLLPLHREAGAGSPLFVYVLVAFALYLSRPVLAAIRRPEPATVPPAVKRAVLGLIVLDAALACGLAGSPGLALVLLLPPALWLGQWVYST